MTNHPMPARKKTLRDRKFLPRLKKAIDALVRILRGDRCPA